MTTDVRHIQLTNLKDHKYSGNSQTFKRVTVILLKSSYLLKDRKQLTYDCSMLQAIMVFTWVDYTPSAYGHYAFPVWADTVGWLITMTSVAAIPFVAVVTVIKHGRIEGSWIETIKFLAKPAEDWGPAIEKHRHIATTHEQHIPLNMSNLNVAHPDEVVVSVKDPVQQPLTASSKAEEANCNNV